MMLLYNNIVCFNFVSTITVYFTMYCLKRDLLEASVCVVSLNVMIIIVINNERLH